jgi:hypothetical protein
MKRTAIWRFFSFLQTKKARFVQRITDHIEVYNHDLTNVLI